MDSWKEADDDVIFYAGFYACSLEQLQFFDEPILDKLYSTRSALLVNIALRAISAVLHHLPISSLENF
ncbi:MAG TPA: hypothetical protein VF691_03025 [Cytophagaceae bacterium]